ETVGVREEDFPAIQAVQQHKLWDHLPDSITPETTEAAITQLQVSDPSFSMAGASWTNNLSWVEGYANVLEPMQQLSADFHRLFDPLIAADPAITTTEGYQRSLLHVLLLETSCFRYWGQGAWTDYASTIHRRGMEQLQHCREQLEQGS
ncbi:MAG: glycosyl hydrolase family 57, partial [bacterium]